MENYGTGYRRGYWQCKKKEAIAPDFTVGKTQYIGAMVLIHYGGCIITRDIRNPSSKGYRLCMFEKAIRGKSAHM
jgi:hypothetical protein